MFAFVLVEEDGLMPMMETFWWQRCDNAPANGRPGRIGVWVEGLTGSLHVALIWGGHCECSCKECIEDIQLSKSVEEEVEVKSG